MPPVWLRTLYRQWAASRGRRVEPSQRPFSRDWPKLLDDAGYRREEDRRVAESELKQLAAVAPPRLLIKTHRSFRYRIERIILPLDQEFWLQSLFAEKSVLQLCQESLQIVDEAARRHHPLYPEMWREWCTRLHAAFAEGRSLRPLNWKEPMQVRYLLGVVFRLTATTWPEGTLVRQAASDLGLKSKELEEKRRTLESCLHALLGWPVSLESLGLILTHSTVQIAGPLILHFEHGETQTVDRMRDVYSLSYDDLKRAVSATTPAARLLSVENSKTTLCQLARRNRAGDTLLAACAFPTKALLRLIELLPPDFPIHHFGDTDPAGFDILSKLRIRSGRHSVRPFLMQRRLAGRSRPLTDYDKSILPRLLSDPHLADVRACLQAVADSQDKGDFEQESLGCPDLQHWPFYSAAQRQFTLPSPSPAPEKTGP